MAPTLKSKLSSLKSNKKKDEETVWILEGIVGYLRSPSWNVPIMNFFDENCYCFENKEENKFEYTDIHIKYKDLVEKLLADYIVELNISEDLFSQACNQHTSTISGVEGMFEYIWAADDFLLFKRLMITQNLEIEMQAINLLHIQDNMDGDNLGMGLTPAEPCSSAQKEPAADDSGGVYVLKEILDESEKEHSAVLRRANRLQDQEAEDLKRAIKYSKEEMERLNARAEEERRMLEEAIRLSLDWSGTSAPADLPKTPADATHLFSSVSAHPASTSQSLPISSQKNNSTKKEPHETKSATTLNQPLPPLRKKTNAEAALDWIASADAENTSTTMQPPAEAASKADLITTSKPSDIDPAALAERKEYLAAQREKLLDLKRKKRDEELKSYQDSSGETSTSRRQKTAKNTDSKKSNSESDKIVNARRALAARLKREVVQKRA